MTTSQDPIVTVENLVDNIESDNYPWMCGDQLRAMTLHPRHEAMIRSELVERMLILRPSDWDLLAEEIASYRSILMLTSDFPKVQEEITKQINGKMCSYVDDMRWAPEWSELRLAEAFNELQALENLGVIDSNYITAFTRTS